MSILDKCLNFTAARQAMAMGHYPYFRVISSEQDTEVIVNGKKMLMMGSNSYLGLTNHPRVMTKISYGRHSSIYGRTKLPTGSVLSQSRKRPSST